MSTHRYLARRPPRPIPDDPFRDDCGEYGITEQRELFIGGLRSSVPEHTVLIDWVDRWKFGKGHERLGIQ